MKLSNILFFLISILLMALPAGYEPDHFAKILFVTALFTSIPICMLMVVLTRKSIAWKRAILVILFILFCFETYLFIRFKTRFNANILTLILQTNQREIGEFFSVYILSFSTVLYLIVFTAGIYGIWRVTKLSGTIEWFRKKIVIIALGLLTLAGLIVRFYPYFPLPVGNNTVRQLLFTVEFVRDTHQEVEKMESLLNQIKVTKPASDQAPVIVLVIGESYNKYHSSLYGYHLPTTPCLEKELNDSLLLCFSHAKSPTNGTNEAMRYIFTLKGCGIQPTSDKRPFILVPAVFRKANYQVAYFDNQYTRSSGGVFDYSCGYFLNPTNINSSCFDFRNNETKTFDGDFISYYKSKLLKQPHSLNIIHLMGQHFDAANRFPDSFQHFSQKDYKRTDLSNSERQQIADYDNATFYNDQVMKTIFDCFRNVNAVIIYLSDHGEQIYDDEHHYYGRTFGSVKEEVTIKAVYEVPFMVWCSPLFKEQNSNLYEKLRQRVDLPLCIADLGYLLFDLADIDFNYNVKSKSILDDSYQPHVVKYN